MLAVVSAIVVADDDALRGRGGARKGAGRPPKDPNPKARGNVEHRRRPDHAARCPVHVTLRAAKGLPSLRCELVQNMLKRQATRDYGTGFQILHFSIQDDHLHFTAEAKGATAEQVANHPRLVSQRAKRGLETKDRDMLRRGIAGIAISFARRWIALTKWNVPYWLAPVVSGAITLGFGWIFGRAVARLEGIYLALATFALATATPQVLKLDALDHWTGGSQGLVFPKPASPLPAVLDDDRWLYFFCVAFAAVLFLGAWNLLRGRTGRALVALRDQPIAASAIGVDVVSYKAKAFGVSAMYTGVAGGLGALLTGFISPDSYPIFLSIQLLVGGVLGGITTILGAVAGAAFIELTPELMSKISDAAPSALYGALLIVCMLAMPGGIGGLVRNARRKWRIQ